jgi:formate hydrogenlyase subunit 3/multisubunit Na+/H+ antiporter MnhD subunit
LTIIFGLASLVALAVFLLNRRYSCILLTGSENCLAEGFGMLSLVVLNVILAAKSFSLRNAKRTAEKRSNLFRMLFLSISWAGMGLAENLFILLIFLYLFLT